MALHTDHIRRLVEQRRIYKDALIYGTQKYQPRSIEPDVVAYFYQGMQNELITIVATSPAPKGTVLTLENIGAISIWVDVITNETFTASTGQLRIPVGACDSEQGVRILRRTDAVGRGTVPPVYPTTSFNPTVFSGLAGELGASWTPYDGRWYQSGASIISDTPAGGATLTYDQRTGANFTYTGTITLLSGLEAGLSFRLGSEFKEVPRVEDVREDYVKGYDVILSRSERRIKVARRPYQVIASYPLQVSMDSPYLVKVIANGSRIQVFLGQVRVIDVFDNKYASGRFGLTNFQSKAKFDNLSATQWTPPKLPYLIYGDIRDKWETLGSDQSPLGMPTTNQSDASNGGKYNEFEHGFIYWKLSLGAHAVYGKIGGKWDRLGRERGFGYPLTDEESAADGVGFYNDFENGGSIYAFPGGDAFEVHGDIRLKWLEMGGVTSPLGYPVTDERSSGNGWHHSDFQFGFIYSKSRTQTYAVFGAIGVKWNALGREPAFGYPIGQEYSLPGGWGQDFENGGSIYARLNQAAFETHGAIRAKWLSMGGASSPLGYPVADEQQTSDGKGRISLFQFGFIYSNPSVGAHTVLGAIGEKWNALGRERGFGYPVTDETGTPDGIGKYNHFHNGGSIYWTLATGAHEVHGAIREKWASLGWERSVLGYPTTDELPTPDRRGRMNQFQHGTIYWYPETGAYVSR